MLSIIFDIPNPMYFDISGTDCMTLMGQHWIWFVRLALDEQRLANVHLTRLTGVTMLNGNTTLGQHWINVVNLPLMLVETMISA